MRRLKVGLNGFGRIGRSFARIALKKDIFDISVINTRKTSSSMLAHLLQYDSVYRKYEKNIESDEKSILVDGKRIITTQNSNIEEIPWEDSNVDVVVDATGAFTKRQDLEKHLKGSVKKVILTAPCKDEEIPHVVLGVNDNEFNWENESIISNASCTTNCAAPLFKVLNNNFKVISGFLTTIHAYTSSQVLVDNANKKFNRSRAAAINIVPTTTGAAKAVVKVIPNLKGKVDGIAVRAPVSTGSFVDISAVVEKQTEIEDVNSLFKQMSENEMKGIMKYEETELVSSDYIGSPYSCIYDSNYTKVINGNFIKVYGWYDNEWGYSCRLVDLIEKISNYIS